MGSRLVGYGAYLPERVVTNKDFEKLMDTTEEWIVSRTGMQERHFARDDETVADMATSAAELALKNSNLSIDDIDMIIVATTTPELDFPSVGVQVQGRLNATKTVPAFDVRGACTGYIYAMHCARAFFAAGMYKRIMIIGAEKMTRFINWEERGTAVLFGDGAGALIFEESNDKDTGIIDTVVMADGTGFGMLHGTLDHKISMNGPETYKKAVTLMPEAAAFIMKNAGITVDQVDWLIPHQANLRIMKTAAETIGFPLEKVVVTVDKYANTSAASGVLALAYGMDNGIIKKGQLILYPAFGSGLTWGSALFRV
ncbi:MAG: ketoacyl-ACP synthase III [Alphaproteobacteria bacterium]|nr:ketoacyl-ACP synthase III [Alphaproteobacteria bacterium]MBN2675469.1 ketoacyl-ACP synthase III [Alphaproteobacteria bacterium]